MVTRAARLPRLTLFSGPNCSLCDIAKAELTKVRQTRPFQLETVNIQDRGQEKWKKKYVYWIPALHLEGKEIAKGRWDAQSIIPALDSWRKENMEKPETGIYIRDCETVLGDEEDADTSAANLGPTCFNCGEPDHTVSACPQPVNRQLVALSRQLYTFLKAARGASDFQRVHEVETWRRQRFEWLDTFEPGKICGPDLIEALEGQDSPWLANMALWGYPKGWVSVRDPREEVRQIIWNDACNEEDSTPEPFLIFGDDTDTEIVHLNGRCGDWGADSEDEGGNCTRDSSSTLSSKSNSNSEQPMRWANFPPSYFSSLLLPVYNGFALPPIEEQHGSSTTFTAERHALWHKITSIISDPPPPPSTSPPPSPPPPPPTLEPPPLPLTPPPPLNIVPTFPLLPPESVGLHLQQGPIYEAHENSDMDMSDSDSD